MPTATITSKGQITIPVAVRRALGLHIGDQVNFVFTSEGRVEFCPATRPVADLKGFFGPLQGEPLTVDQMDQAVADSLAESMP